MDFPDSGWRHGFYRSLHLVLRGATRWVRGAFRATRLYGCFSASVLIVIIGFFGGEILRRPVTFCSWMLRWLPERLETPTKQTAKTDPPVITHLGVPQNEIDDSDLFGYSPTPDQSRPATPMDVSSNDGHPLPSAPAVCQAHLLCVGG